VVRYLAAFLIMIAPTVTVMLLTGRAGYTVVESYLALLVVGAPVLVACIALSEGIGPRTVRNGREP
jgi:hypothetical protein